ncbi:MAG: hypothetical protein ACRDZ2_02580 [Ilumatobacteraceae bacterium]
MPDRTENTMSRAPSPDMAKLNAAGLVVAAVGIVIQIVGGIDFPAVPPGLVIVVVAAGLVAYTRWGWVSYVGVVVPVFLLVGGTLAISNEDEPNRTDVVGLGGTVVQAIGLVVALIAGLQVLRQMRSRRAGRA